VASLAETVAADRRRALVVLLVLAVVGLYLVKWDPLAHKAVLASVHHQAGASVLTGDAASPPPPSWRAAGAYAATYVRDVWQAMVLGLVLGAGVEAVLPAAWLRRLFGRLGARGVVWASLLAVPCMMCTCCSAPVAAGLGRRGANPGAVAAYWLGNPTLNPATIVLIGFVLGWRWALLRVLAGVVLVLVAGLWIGRGAAEAAVAAEPAEEASGSVWVRWLRGLGRLALGVVPEWIVLVLLLGAARAWLFPAVDPRIGHALWLVPALAVAGTLFVIPTAGEVPILQVLGRYGLGPGPFAALLVALPAISLPSMAMVAARGGARAPAMVLRAAAVVAAVACAVGLVAWAVGV
jgi:uncharacterized membrane protein YraQ (UPF0718 family)